MPFFFRRDETLNLSKQELLKQKITVESPEIRFDDIYKNIKKETNIILFSKIREFNTDKLCVFYKDCELYKLMDGISSIFLARWEKKSADKFMLIERFENALGWVPTTDEEIARSNAAQPFITDYLKLNSELKNKLKPDPEYISYKNAIPLQDLPNEMQLSINDQIKELNRFMKPNERPISSDDISSGRINVEGSKGAFGSNEMFITISTKHGSYGWIISDIQKAIDSGIAKKDNHFTYAPTKFEIQKKDFYKEKELMREVYFRGNGVYISDIMQFLHEEFGYNCVTEPKKILNIRKNVNIPPMPAWRFLDAVTQLFPETEWEYRKMGTLIIRGPRNPARGSGDGKTKIEMK